MERSPESGMGARIDGRTVVRSALIGLAMTAEVMALQFARGRLIVHDAPPSPGRLIAVSACYLAANFAYALGFFLFADRLPGESWAGKALRYAIMVFMAVWFSGLVAMMALDFEGGFDLLSAAKVKVYWMALCDTFNLFAGAFLIWLAVRWGRPAVRAEARITANLAARMAAGAVMLPPLAMAGFYAMTLVLPSGFDLSGSRAAAFYFFIFAPLAVSGAGAALFQEALGRASGGGIAARAIRSFIPVFTLYWLTNDVFIPFLGFTWRSLADFLPAAAVALFLTLLALEAISRVQTRPEYADSTIVKEA
jgi:hypothetical protein